MSQQRRTFYQQIPSIMFRSVALVATATAVTAAEWSLISETSSAALMGVGAASASVAVAAASDNGSGGALDRYNGETWTKYSSGSGLNLDAAVLPSGVSVESTGWPVLLFNGADHITVPDIHGSSQSASAMGDSFFGLVGGFVAANTTEVVNGVAYSRDAGASWKITAPIPTDTFARYGAFPSSDTWYVSCGMWGEAPAVKSVERPFSRHVELSNDKVLVHPRVKLTEETGWIAAIAKTTDGGATWTNVFNSDTNSDFYYFNAIACSNEAHCVAVAEGYNADGSYLTQAFVTFDGGDSWDITLKTSDLSLMGASWVSDVEGWLAGTSVGSKRAMIGMFYHTTDGGKTWNLEQQLDDCYALDLTFADGVGFAACSSSSGSSCSVALYK